MEEISFFIEDIDFVFDSGNIISKWINNSILEEDQKYSKINIVFCSDQYLLLINKQYLNHDYYTDIITFPYHKSNQNSPIEGDIFISIPRIEENANEYFTNFTDELHRVIIHGVLHLIGYNDISENDKALMKQKEDYYLSKRNF